MFTVYNKLELIAKRLERITYRIEEALSMGDFKRAEMLTLMYIKVDNVRR